MTVPYPNWYRNEPAIMAELRRGHRNMLKVAAMLEELGFELEYEKELIRRTGPHDQSWIDEKDIWVKTGHLLEVKGRGLRFDDPDSVPFDTVLVGNVERWKQRQRGQLCAVVVLSELTWKTFAFPIETFPQWEPAFVFDRLRGYWQCSYEVDKKLAKSWEWFVEHLWGDCA